MAIFGLSRRLPASTEIDSGQGFRCAGARSHQVAQVLTTMLGHWLRRRTGRCWLEYR